MKRKFAPRGPGGHRENGRHYGEDGMGPFDQKVLTKKELLVLDKLFNKIFRAKDRFHKAGKCKIENEGIWPCEAEVRLAEGKIHHYPNGFYI